jgi:hypothetical protein
MEHFAVRSGISLAVEYGPDRMACQLLIAPAQPLVQFLQNPIPPIPSQGVSDVLQELLPVATRGKQINSTATGNALGILLETDYENSSIRRFCRSESCVSSNENQDLRSVVVFRRATCHKHVE